MTATLIPCHWHTKYSAYCNGCKIKNAHRKPDVHAPVAVVIEATLLGTTGRCLQMLANMNDFPVGTKFYAHPPKGEAS